MRKVRILLFFIFISLKLVIAQSPNLMSYQAVIWDANGNLVAEKTVNIKISILKGSVTGVIVYSETHRVQTNINGLVNLMIGGGSNPVGKILDIDWNTGTYFLKTETDPTGGGNYSIIGVTQFVSVPYSMFSEKSANVYTTTPGLPGQVLTMTENGRLSWSGIAYPKVITKTILTPLTSSIISLGGEVITDGGAPVTSRGVVWSNSPQPDISLSTKTSDGNGIGSFTATLTNLKPKTTYYVRAYATNSSGTGYGNELTFTTSDSLNVMNIPCPGILTVKDIDGNTYNTVQIGKQCWMKENLRTTKYRDGTSIPLDLTGGVNGNNNNQKWNTFSSGVRTIYAHDEKNIVNFGYLYNWFAVADTKGICPLGWIIPRDIHWEELANSLGGNVIAGGKMKTVTGWQNPNLGATNESGFSGLAGGIRLDNDGSFSGFGQTGYWWSSTSFNSSTAVARILNNNDSVLGFIQFDNQAGFSVRCIKDSTTTAFGNLPTIITTQVNGITHISATSGGNITSDGGFPVTSRGVVWSTSPEPTVSLSTKTNNGVGIGSFSSSLSNLSPNTTFYVRAYATNNMGTGYGKDVSFSTTSSIDGLSCPETPMVKDIDNNSYNTVKIGNQCWMKENLKVSKYRTGEAIPTGLNNTDWLNTKNGAYAIYDNSNVNDAIYGKLYNWYAVRDSRGLCPTGWHVPTDAEWTTLTNFLGGEVEAGGKMKSMGTTYWQSPNTGATNESGFSGLPGGTRFGNGNFLEKNYLAFFWTNTEKNSNSAWIRSLINSEKIVERLNGLDKLYGNSVRCLKD